MKISLDDEPISEINMTPFVDIILVVLIIFMVTASFASYGKIPVNLPSASIGDSKEAKHHSITIDKDGNFYINDKSVLKDNLKTTLAQLLNNKDDLFVLKSDESCEFKYVVHVLDACKQLGIENISIATVTNEQ